MNALYGRTIVITRAADQAAEMSRLVASFDAVPVIVPMIEVVDEPNGIAALLSLDLEGVDWIVVTSPNGAVRVTPLIEVDSAAPMLAAVGSATAAALPRCELVADTQSASGLLEVFPPGPGNLVVVQAVDAEHTMVKGLLEREWNVVVIRPYRSVRATPTAEQQRAALDADAVLFASGSAVRAWVEVFGLRSPPVVVVIGQQTAAVAEAAGLKISATSADHSMYGMLVTLDTYLAGPN